MKKFTADFETNVDVEDCRVWAWAICEIGNPSNFIYGNNITTFIEWCSNKRANYVLYFHNLKFDASYILSYLLNNGYEFIENKKDKRDKTFTTLISDMGQFYSLEIYFEVNGKRTNKVTIYDSFKILAFSVETIAKSFNLPIRKLELDYKTKREIGHKLTDHEIEYIRCDVEIMARALEIMFTENLTKMTIGSNALSYYKKMTKNFNRYFPSLPYEIDKDIRQSYKGGFTYLSPLYKGKTIENELVLDVNSLYPYVLHEKALPYGQPIFFKGEYQKDALHPLYIQMIDCIFEIKDNMIPTIQLKNNLSFLPNEYITSSKGQNITLVLTNVDLELFKEHYNIIDPIYIAGWKFRARYGLFSSYVDRWTEEKIKAKKEKNKSMYTISKLLLNSLYGKFSKNPKTRSKYPYLDEEGIVRYSLSEEKIEKALYIPVGTFVTSYAREKTIRTSQKIRDYTLKVYGEDYYIYSDTDSIHLKYLNEEELKQFVDIDDYRLGAWKIEERAKRGKYIRQKCYIQDLYISEEEYIEGIKGDASECYTKDENGFYCLKCTVAGLPKSLAKYINFENFEKGFNILAEDTSKEHKLTYKHVKGGVLLVDTDFTIK